MFLYILQIYSIVLSFIPDTSTIDTHGVCILAMCVPIESTSKEYAIGLTIIFLIPLIIMIITSSWTFIFTKLYLKKTLQRQRSTLSRSDIDVQESVYNVKVLKLVGIFGALFFFNFVSFVPFFILTFTDVATSESVSVHASAAVLIFFLLSNVTNPLIQSYFRRDLKDSVVKIGRRLKCSKKKLVYGTSKSHTVGFSISGLKETEIDDSVFLPDDKDLNAEQSNVANQTGAVSSSIIEEGMLSDKGERKDLTSDESGQ